MLGLKAHLLTALISATLAASSAAWVQSQRYGLQLEQLKHQQTRADLASQQSALGQLRQYQEDLTDALQQFQHTQQQNEAAAHSLHASLLELRTATGGLRSITTTLPQRIDAAATPAIAEYAHTCTTLLAELAERGGRMAEVGAGVARAADGHSADAALVRESWPTPSRPDGGK